MPIIVRDALPISQRTYTEEGFLVAPAVLATAGVLPYLARELQLTDRDPDAHVMVYRSPDELRKAVPSFESQPVTVDHPRDDIDASNWRSLAVGDVRDVSMQGDAMRATVIVRDKAAVEEVKSGRKQLSNGYRFEIHKAAPNSGYEFEQRNIIGNHIAIVDRARSGQECRIGDREPVFEEDQLLQMVGPAVDQAFRDLRSPDGEQLRGRDAWLEQMQNAWQSLDKREEPPKKELSGRDLWMAQMSNAWKERRPLRTLSDTEIQMLKHMGEASK